MRKFVSTGLLLAILVAITLQCTSSATTGKRTEAITPKNAKADYIMQVLGYDKDGKHYVDKFTLTRVVVQNGMSGDPAPVAAIPSLVPKGIDSIELSESGAAIIVTGDTAAVAELKATINKLDIKPRTISIAASIYEISDELESKLDAYHQRFTTNPAKDLPKQAIEAKSLVDELTTGEAKVVSPSLSVLDTIPSFSVLDKIMSEMKTETKLPYKDPTTGESKELIAGRSICVKPCINEDNSITVALYVSFNEVELDRNIPTNKSFSIGMQSRVTSGTPIIIGGFKVSPGKMKIVVITPTIAVEPANSNSLQK